MLKLFNLFQKYNQSCRKCLNNNYKTSFNWRLYSSSDSIIKKLQKPSENNNPEYGPIKYTTSPALYWRAKYSRQGKIDTDTLWYEPYVILGSTFIFLVYFGILREENDLDEELTKTLYSRIDGLEETQLRLSLKYNIEHGIDTQSIVERLKEIELNKKLVEECK